MSDLDSQIDGHLRRYEAHLTQQSQRQADGATTIAAQVASAEIAAHEAAADPHPQYNQAQAQTTVYDTAGSTTYTPPSWARTLHVDVVGGGAGGGGGAVGGAGTWRYGGTGGGGGGRTQRLVTRDQFAGVWPTITATVGGGGAGGASEANGDPGGDSEVAIGGVIYALALGGEPGLAGLVGVAPDGGYPDTAVGAWYGAWRVGQADDPPGGRGAPMAGAAGACGGNLDDTDALRAPGSGADGAEVEGAGALLGAGGAGGAAALGGNGSAGSVGGAGCGGGGGGAAETGFAAGPGGDGGDGLVIITAW